MKKRGRKIVPDADPVKSRINADLLKKQKLNAEIQTSKSKKRLYFAGMKSREEREAEFKRLTQKICRTTQDLRYKTKDVPCEWLSREKFVLPEVVNVVYTATFASPCIKTKLDLIRLAQYLPNGKYRPPSFAAISIRLYPTAAMIFQSLSLVQIRATTKYMALLYSHLYRNLIENIPLILRQRDAVTGELTKPYIGTLKGMLGYANGTVCNVVGSGFFPQDGVNLTSLLMADEDNSDYNPNKFPNLIYPAILDGKRFFANIAMSGKVVFMGCSSETDMYQAYRYMCGVVHDFEDSGAPKDPKQRYLYRFNQMKEDSRFFDAKDKAKLNAIPGYKTMGDMRFLENLGDAAAGSGGGDEDEEYDDDDDDDDGDQSRAETTASGARSRRSNNNNNNNDDDLTDGGDAAENERIMRVAELLGFRGALEDKDTENNNTETSAFSSLQVTASASAQTTTGFTAMSEFLRLEEEDNLKNQSENALPLMPLLYQAAISGQINNVKFILNTRDDPEMEGAVWRTVPGPGPDGRCELLAIMSQMKLETPVHAEIRLIIEKHLRENRGK